jgi:hypothetical protein
MCMTWTEEELRTELDRYEAELRDAGKARNTVTTYVQPVERFLNWLEGRYSPARTVAGTSAALPNSPHLAAHRGTSRYVGLRVYLSQRSEQVVRLSFADIETIIGAPLPASARRYRTWWANEQSGTHVHARSWLDAGRRTANVDLNAAAADFVL